MIGAGFVLYVIIVSIIAVHFYWYLPDNKRGNMHVLMCTSQSVHSFSMYIASFSHHLPLFTLSTSHSSLQITHVPTLCSIQLDSYCQLFYSALV